MNTGGDDRPMDDEALAARSRARFERAVRQVPVATANRLRLARRAALAEGGASPARPMRWLVPLGASAALVLGLAWWRGTVEAPPAPGGAPATFAVDALPAEDDADLYAWLAEAPVASDAGSDAL